MATCLQAPELEADDRFLLPALAARDIEGVPAVWDDFTVDWDAFDLVLVRATWDYAERRDAFLAWVRSLRRVENSIPVLEWNTDKQRYLTDLREAGVPIVPTEFLPPGTSFEPPCEPFVVKPSISAGGRSSAWFHPDDEEAESLVARIHTEGRTAMVQPYLADAEEKALVYIGSEYSHALVRRVPLPASGSRAVFYLEERLESAEATPHERATAEAAIACAPDEPMYGRVDLLGGAVLELELTEPSLYFAYGGGSADRLAAAIATAVTSR